MPPPTKPKHLLVLLIVAFFAAAAAAAAAAAGDGGDTVLFYPTAEAAAAAHCDGTLYPELCQSTLADIPDLHKKALPDVISAAVNRTEDVVAATASNCSSYLRDRTLTARDRLAIGDCMELLATTMDELQATVADLESPAAAARSGGNGSASAAARHMTMDHVMTVLSAAITNQYTCLDGFAYQNGGRVRRYMEPTLHHVSRMVSNSLAMAKKLPGAGAPRPSTAAAQAEMKTTTAAAATARQPFMGYGQMVKGFPRWVRPGDRRLLQAPAAGITADAVVAQDGSGKYRTVSEAVAAAPTGSKKRYVIYIKAGAYMENVEVGKKHTNLMFVGDGIGKTVIKASRNVVDGSTTFRSATVVAVVGNNFLARDLTIENGAGPSKHQAVALRVGADLSAFYRCSFVGYQDTLYVHSLRQFFRDCDVYGTIDFVFGNAAAVFQGCNLYARRPLPNQHNIFTAQGREDPNQNTGISIHRCKVAAAADLAAAGRSATRTYLGRPWKQYSRTVFMESELDAVVDPAGWLEWSGDFALDTLYYGEYMNTGAGAGTAGRVKWKGYHVITSAAEASAFTVGSFIDGDVWLAGTSVPFTTGL
ncbi:hypothetical protein ACP4OV_020673 [Aristida adscensionis]